MKVLVIGSGGREHALAWKIAQSPRVSEVIVTPGNAGTATEPGVRNADVAVTDIDGLLTLAVDEDIDLTVVGPEAALAVGVVDRFRAANLRCFGPTSAAAQLESSKAFAKEFLARHNIPTAQYAVFSDLDAALAHVREHGAPVVIKADGLAAGKGVVVAMTLTEAEQALVDMLGAQRFGDASARVVIEEFLEGEEASYIVISDGTRVLPLATSQDHKRRDDGDRGPNTGGMGACSPAPVVTVDIERRVLDEIVAPTIAGMAADGLPFVGFLYVGLMIDASGVPKVIEYNARLGDPEAQPILLRLESDLVDLVETALDGHLEAKTAEWDARPAIAVVLAADGYPGEARRGDPIEGLDSDFGADVKIFHAGTRIADNDEVVSDGGRVLAVCALGDDFTTTREKTYSAIDALRLDGSFYRTDIAGRTSG